MEEVYTITLGTTLGLDHGTHLSIHIGDSIIILGIGAGTGTSTGDGRGITIWDGTEVIIGGQDILIHRTETDIME